MKRSWDATERHTLLTLDSLLRRPSVRARIDAVVERLEPALAADPKAQMAWETLPLALFDPGLPETIQSGWVFILRKGCVTGAERHPNSHQRTLSYRGRGDLQTMTAGSWVSHKLSSDGAAPLAKRWVSIPVNSWHQVVSASENWVVVSFHTAPAEKLIEERPRPENPQASRRRLYVGAQAR